MRALHDEILVAELGRHHVRPRAALPEAAGVVPAGPARSRDIWQRPDARELGETSEGRVGRVRLRAKASLYLA